MAEEYVVTIVQTPREPGSGEPYTVLTRTMAEGHAEAVAWGRQQARGQFPHAEGFTVEVTARLARPQQQSLFD